VQVVIIPSSNFLVRLCRLTGTATAASLKVFTTSLNSLTAYVLIIFLISDGSVEIALAEVNVTAPGVGTEALDEDDTCFLGLLLTFLLPGILRFIRRSD
jgi:hypothetical protein